MMCIEDIRLGRKSPGHMVRETVGVTNTQILSNDPSRTSIVFNAPSAGVITFTPGTDAVALQGLAMNLGDSPVILTLKDQGELVTGPWFAIADAGGRVATLFITSFPDGHHAKTRE